MRLPPPLVDLLARRTIRGLMADAVITSDHPDRTAEKVARLITADLKTEDDITEEARRILMDHQAAIKNQDVEYHHLLAKVKAEVAAKRGYMLSSGPGKISREKVMELGRQVTAMLLEDDDVEYFVKDEAFRNAVVRALEREVARDAQREEQARQKVRNIKRRIPEESAEFQTLYLQFYRELLDREG